VGTKRSGDLATCQRQPGTSGIVRPPRERSNREPLLALGDHQAPTVRVGEPHLARRARAPVTNLADNDTACDKLLSQCREVIGVEVEEDGLLFALGS
jgi:hypothetical protein